MANDQKERCNAEQKEGAQGAACRVQENPQTQEFDTEFAADSWMGAVFNPESTNANNNNNKLSNGTASYDPQRYTETYMGTSEIDESTLSAANLSEPTASTTDLTEDHRSEQVAARSRVDGDAYYGEDADRLTKYETAAEFAPPLTTNGERRDNGDTSPRSPVSESERAEPASGLGWTGLGLSILSLFFMPYLLGAAGMVIGYLAFRRNARTLGTWAMIIGAVAILGAIIVYPFFVAR